MGRWRPPSAPSSRYITPEGYRALDEELQYLWKVRRPEVTQSVREAAAQGDRSENAEYIYGKKMLREIDRRIRFLAKRLDDMTVVDRPPDDQSRVYFAARVVLEDVGTGTNHTYRIVGPDEINAGSGDISVDSPLARALLKRQRGDEVTVATPSGEHCYHILSIDYDGNSP